MLRLQHRDKTAGRWQSATAEALSSGSLLSEPVREAVPAIAPGLGRRLLDIAIALAGLTLLWPLLVCVSVAARLSTGGTAIYRQRRIGQGGVPFTLLKFRTMRAWAQGPEVTAPGDHRVTRLGALLRRTSVDELPQLVNVLLGTMTLVGPRPESVALAMRYPAEFRFVFRYRPGLTGPSQVLVHDEQMLRPVADVEEFYLTDLVPRRVAMDLEYLRNPTLAQTIRWISSTVLYLIRPGQNSADSAPSGLVAVATPSGPPTA
jgi:lipopolysaccharide/colanic/teichoic acid biosynthesis glycosyltransferase